MDPSMYASTGSWAGMPYDMPSYGGPSYGGPPGGYMEMPQHAHQYGGPGYGPPQGYGGTPFALPGGVA